MLSSYKAQGVFGGGEFWFVKAPLFFADSLFLKRPERQMALLMVLGLALLVYALAAHKVRIELVRWGENPNQPNSRRCGDSSSSLRGSMCCGCRRHMMSSASS